MIIKLLNKLLRKYMWTYERYEGDKGFVLAKSREDAIRKLGDYYSDAAERIRKTDKDEKGNYFEMWVYDADHTETCGDIFINVPW